MIKNSLETITVNKTELKNIESLLVKTNFELYEIWTPDEDNEVQVWSNKNSLYKIFLLYNSQLISDPI